MIKKGIWNAYARTKRNGELTHIGQFKSEGLAQQAVIDKSKPARRGLRCLFHWQEHHYRCGSKDEHIYGYIVPPDKL